MTAIPEPSELSTRRGEQTRPDRLYRRPAAGGVCRLPGAAFDRLDGAADAALRQPAARSDRGPDLRPRVAARLRQAAAAAVVAHRDHASAVRRRHRLLRAGASRGDRRFRFGVRRGAAAGRRSRRARGRRDHRRPALLPVHRGEVQPRRHAAAVLGAGRLRIPCRAQARPHGALAAARPGLRRRAVGQIFCRRPGRALRAVPAVRPRRPPHAGDAGTVACARRRARHRGAARAVAVPDRLSALCLCEPPRRAGARLVRPYQPSGRVRRQPDLLPAAVVADRRRFVLAAHRLPSPLWGGVGGGGREAPSQAPTMFPHRTTRRPTLPRKAGGHDRPTLSTAASWRCSPSGHSSP